MGLVALGVVALAGCRPEVSFDPNGRRSKIDGVDVAATVRLDGVLHVEQRYRFDSGDGGTVALPKELLDPSLPPVAQSAVGGIRDVTLDGAPVTPVRATFQPEVRIKRRTATLAYDVVGAVQRYSDIAIARLNALTGPEDASRQDPDVALQGTLALPEGPAGTIEPHFHGGRDRTVTSDGSTIRFSSAAPIWQPNHEVDVAFPADRVPDLARTPIPFLEQFHTEQTIRDQADRDTESTLGGIDDQTDLSRWLITAIAFGLPLIFWTLVLVGLIRRLRERKAAVGYVPHEVSDPPTAIDPAIVAVLDGEGRPARTAVAGTILDLARRKDVDLQEYGDKIVLKVPLATVGVNGSEKTVLDELRRAASADGTLEGPRVWKGPAKWWRAYRRDLVKRARGMGLVERWMPLASLSTALVTTGIGFSLFFFTQPVIYFVMVFGAIILGYVISFVSGHTLTDKGWRQRALWRSFARYIHDNGQIDKAVGPAGVVVWGPYLVYGAVLGEAHAAARPLTPERMG